MPTLLKDAILQRAIELFSANYAKTMRTNIFTWIPLNAKKYTGIDSELTQRKRESAENLIKKVKELQKIELSNSEFIEKIKEELANITEEYGNKGQLGRCITYFKTYLDRAEENYQQTIHNGQMVAELEINLAFSDPIIQLKIFLINYIIESEVRDANEVEASLPEQIRYENKTLGKEADRFRSDVITNEKVNLAHKFLSTLDEKMNGINISDITNYYYRIFEIIEQIKTEEKMIRDKYASEINIPIGAWGINIGHIPFRSEAGGGNFLKGLENARKKIAEELSRHQKTHLPNINPKEQLDRSILSQNSGSRLETPLVPHYHHSMQLQNPALSIGAKQDVDHEVSSSSSHDGETTQKLSHGLSLLGK